MASRAQGYHVQPVPVRVTEMVVILRRRLTAVSAHLGSGSRHTSCDNFQGDSVMSRLPFGVFVPVVLRRAAVNFFTHLRLLVGRNPFKNCASVGLVHRFLAFTVARFAHSRQSPLSRRVGIKSIIRLSLMAICTGLHIPSKKSAPVSRSALWSRQCGPTGAHGKENPTNRLPRQFHYIPSLEVCQCLR